MKKDKDAVGAMYRLLANACSMLLSPKTTSEPFRPVMVMDGRRTAIPEDLSEADVDFFSTIVNEIDDVMWRARLADLVWLPGKPRDPEFALVAIDAYCHIPLDTESWRHDGREGWERAVRLAQMLRAGAGIGLGHLESQRVDTLLKTTEENGFLRVWLAELPEKTRPGTASQAEIATQLQELADKFRSNDELHHAREHHAAAKTYGQAGNDEVTAGNIAEYAETWVKEAQLRLTCPPLDRPSAIRDRYRRTRRP